MSCDVLARSLERPESWWVELPWGGGLPLPGSRDLLIGVSVLVPPSAGRLTHVVVGVNCCWRRSRRRLFSVQKLSAGTLKKLGLPQAKARHLPLHLHARQLVLPALGPRKEELSLVCRLPRYFLRSLGRLGLEVPSPDRDPDDGAGRRGAQ